MTATHDRSPFRLRPDHGFDRLGDPRTLIGYFAPVTHPHAVGMIRAEEVRAIHKGAAVETSAFVGAKGTI